MKDRLFARELEVGLELLARADPGGRAAPPTATPESPGRPTRARFGMLAWVAAGAAVVGATLWIDRGSRVPDGSTSAAQDPVPPTPVKSGDVGAEQILAWISALSGPQRHAAGAELVIHGRQAIPFLAEALAEETAPIEPILLVLGCCSADASAAMDATLDSLRSRTLELEHAHSVAWAMAQLALHTDRDLRGVERRFMSWHRQPPTGAAALEIQRLFVRREAADLGDHRSLPQLVNGCAERLAHADSDDMPPFDEWAASMETLAEGLGIGDGTSALCSAADPTIPAAGVPSRWSPARDANGSLRFVLARAAEDAPALTVRQAAKYSTLLYLAAAATRSAPDDPRTVPARMILAAASVRESDRVWHLTKLLTGDPDALRASLRTLEPLLLDSRHAVAHRAADVVSVAMADAGPGAREATWIERWASGTQSPGARAVLSRLLGRLRK